MDNMYRNLMAPKTGIKLRCPITSCGYNVILTVKDENSINTLKDTLIETCICPQCHGNNLTVEINNYYDKRNYVKTRTHKQYYYRPVVRNTEITEEIVKEENKDDSFYSRKSNKYSYDKLCKLDAFCEKRDTCPFKHSDVIYHHYPKLEYRIKV